MTSFGALLDKFRVKAQSVTVYDRKQERLVGWMWCRVITLESFEKEAVRTERLGKVEWEETDFASSASTASERLISFLWACGQTQRLFRRVASD